MSPNNWISDYFKNMDYKTKRSFLNLRVNKNYEIKDFKTNGYAGTHLLIDFWHSKKIEKKDYLERLLSKGAEESGANLLSIKIHKFEPEGITGVATLSESHIAIHTWPEINYIAIDIFTCGNALPEKALQFFKEELLPKKVIIKKIKRGKKI